MKRLSRDTTIAAGTALLIVATMAIDHLIGTEVEAGEDDAVLDDPVAFLVAVGISFALLAALFRFVVPGGARDDDRAAKAGIVCGALSIPALALTLLALPLPFAGAAIALGLHEPRRCAQAARDHGRRAGRSRRRARDGGPSRRARHVAPPFAALPCGSAALPRDLRGQVTT